MTERLPTMREVATLFCWARDVSFDDMRSRSRRRALCRARDDLMLELASRTKASFPQIADFLHRADHTTVMQGARRAFDRERKTPRSQRKRRAGTPRSLEERAYSPEPIAIAGIRV